MEWRSKKQNESANIRGKEKRKRKMESEDRG